ncbi:polysaccharide biosynthesis protein [Bacteroides hominis]|uniref:polysaccharide biosynthesis protein n=1 Tax=Bacteroides hominis TaxID=2763023 RepID=UPI003D6CB648
MFNLALDKHVRSEKDEYSVQALIENNVIKAKKLLDRYRNFLPVISFGFLRQKAANPVDIMGASKRIMEDMYTAYSFKI